MPPFEGQDLALDAPAGDVGERDYRLNRGRQLVPNGREHSIVEESRARVPFLQHRELGNPAVVLVIGRGQPEGAPNDRQLPIDLGV